MVVLGKYDVSFPITITSKESVAVLPEMTERAKRTLETVLNDPKVKKKLERHFDLHQDDVRCEVGDLIVKPGQYPSLP
jgi:hypothetical protein